jgi:hypothetical protein
MSNRIVCTTLALGLMAAMAHSQPNVLVNGDLDRTYNQVIFPGLELPKPATWINVGNRSITGPYEDELSSENWAGPAPTPVTRNGFNETTGHFNRQDWGVFFKPFSGNPVDGAATGHLYQDVPALTGWIYTLTGWAGAEANFMAADAQFAIDWIGAGGGVMGSVVLSLMPTLTVPNAQPFNYKQYTVTGIAPVGATHVRARISMIDGMPNPAGGGQAFVVDDFVMTAVPEPGTIAALGLGALLLARRRKRKQSG